MAPAIDYLFLSIETLVNTVALIVMIPCMGTLLKTQGTHGNCKVLLVTSGCVQLSLLLVQMALFIHDFIIGNLTHVSEKETGFTMAQNTLFTMSSYLSLSLVLERTFAVWKAAAYEKSGRHIFTLILTIATCLGLALATVYAIFWHKWNYEAIFIVYGVEGVTFVISIVIIIYARRKFAIIPYGEDRLNAKYQVKEVLDFSIAILPSVLVSVFMHTLSLVPTILWINGVFSYQISCVIYFPVHSLNCIVTKLTLIGCHKGMRQRFQLLFVDRLSFSTPRGARIVRNYEKEGKEHFEQMKAAWDQALPKEGNSGSRRI